MCQWSFVAMATIIAIDLPRFICLDLSLLSRPRLLLSRLLLSRLPLLPFRLLLSRPQHILSLARLSHPKQPDTNNLLSVRHYQHPRRSRKSIPHRLRLCHASIPQSTSNWLMLLLIKNYLPYYFLKTQRLNRLLWGVLRRLRLRRLRRLRRS